MKEYLIFGIFLFLLRRKKTTAKEIALDFEISTRSVYRYIDALSLIGVPVITKIGKGGGIEIVGDVYLENLCLSKNDKQVLKQFVLDGKNIDAVKTVLNKII